jgi:adenylate kinase family enzyme
MAESICMTRAWHSRGVHAPRSDDNLEAIKSRIAQYKENVNAVRGYFRPITHEIDGVGDKNVIAAKIASIILEAR